MCQNRSMEKFLCRFNSLFIRFEAIYWLRHQSWIFKSFSDATATANATTDATATASAANKSRIFKSFSRND